MMAAAYRLVGDVSVEAGRGAGQLGWYRFFAPKIAGWSVLDVGCGLGAGLKILRQAASEARGQDRDPRLAEPDIHIGDISGIDSKSVDFITCVDVIEHVEQDRAFFLDLARIARKGMFLSTPLSIRGRKKWEYHVREYRFDEFVALTADVGACRFYKGDPSGETVYRIDNPEAFSGFHKLLNNPVTQLPARIVQKALPQSWRNLAHQAVEITLD